MADAPKLPQSPMSDTQPDTERKWWRLRAIGVAGVLLVGYGLAVWTRMRWTRDLSTTDALVALALLSPWHLPLLALVLIRMLVRCRRAWWVGALALKLVAIAGFGQCLARGAIEGWDAAWALTETPRAAGALLLLWLPSAPMNHSQKLWQSLAASLFGLGIACAGVIRVVEVWGATPRMFGPIPSMAAIPHVVAVMLVVATVHLIPTRPREGQDEGPDRSLREHIPEVTAWLRKRIAEIFS